MNETQIDLSSMDFEQALAELERLVTQLESAQISLDDSIRLSSRGAQLRKHCEAKLREAEEKVSKINLDSDGKPSGLEPLSD